MPSNLVYCRAEDVMSIMDLLLADMPYCSTLLQITPVFRTHQGSWDKVSTDLEVGSVQAYMH